jgi:hypothetical protein
MGGIRGRKGRKKDRIYERVCRRVCLSAPLTAPLPALSLTASLFITANCLSGSASTYLHSLAYFLLNTLHTRSILCTNNSLAHFSNRPTLNHKLEERKIPSLRKFSRVDVRWPYG